jgi:hypothetical protein
MSPRLLRPVASAFHPEAQVWRNSVIAEGGTVSGSTLKAVSDFCKSIDQAGIRSKFRRLNLFCGDSDASLIAARVPLYRGESRTGTQYGNTLDTNVNFVQADYTENSGLTGNGTSKYLNTGFNVDQLPAADDCHLSTYIRGTQDITAARGLIGAIFNSVTDRYRIAFNTASAGNYITNAELGKATQATVTLPNTSDGLFLLSRTSATSLTLYRNSTSVATNATSTAQTLGAFPFFVFARNSALNAPVEYYNGTMAGYSIGAGMDAAASSAYYTALQAFQTALGRNA